MLETFYATSAQVCFALLGLWWVVVQFKYQEWLHDPGRRRMAYDISAFFALPGIMSLASLMAERLTYLWQVGFAVAGMLGVIETIAVLRSSGGRLGTRLFRGIHVLTLVLYVAIVTLGVRPKLPADLGLNLKGREVEAILLSLLIFLGTNLAWLMFFGRPMTSLPPRDVDGTSTGATG